MPLRRAILSALTLFGGHFLNRRRDRVALIGVLLVAAVIASAAQVYTLLGIEGVKFYSSAIWASRLPLISVLAIAALSAGLTFRDARRSATGSLTTAMRIIRLPVTLVGALILAAAFRVAAISPTTWSNLQTDTNLATAGHLYFGHSNGPVAMVIPNAGYWTPRPPEGPHPLRGRITLEGAGLEGVRISLVLDDQYTAVLYSDPRGNFETSLPAGKWRINEVIVSDWEGRPRTRPLVLFSSNEPLKGSGLYSRFNQQLARTQGLEVSLPADASAIPVALEFRYAMPITWPSAPGQGEGVPETELSSAAIAWEPVERASEYEVQISQMMSSGSIEFPALILTRRVSGLSLPLVSLPQRTASTPADQYAVHVFAFDAAGRLLRESSPESENPLKSNDRMFRLTGAARLGREQQYVGFDGPVQVISAEYERNEERLDEARDLMRAKRFDEARHQLEVVTQDAPPGRAWALRGTLAALQGDCKTALKLFDKADEEAGGGCASSEARSLCPAP